MIPLVDTVVILSAPEAVDRYNNAYLDWSTPVRTEARALVQVGSIGQESSGLREQQRIDGFLFLEPGAAITAKDRIEWNGQVWAVDGTPARPGPPGREHHVEVRLLLVQDGPR